LLAAVFEVEFVLNPFNDVGISLKQILYIVVEEVMDNKYTCAVIGLSDNPDRYAYKAAKQLLAHDYPVIGYGLRNVNVLGINVITDKKPVHGVGTVTLYVGPRHQEAWMPLLLDLKPRRIIFNPGTENHENQLKLEEAGIEVVEACTLVMLSIGTF